MLVLLSSCAADRNQGQQHPPQPVVTQTARDVYALGSAVTPEGAVPRDASGETFRRGSEIFLSVNVDGASTGQKIEVRWLAPEGSVIRADEMEVPVGSRFAAFSTGETSDWPQGEHRAVVIINGRRVTERPFQLM